jgi:competence protein ComEC
MPIENKAFLFFLFFICGVLASSLGTSLSVLLVINIIVCLLFVCAHILKFNRRLLIVGFLTLAIFLGAFYSRAYEYIKFEKSSVVYGKSDVILGKIVSSPTNSQKSQSFDFETEQGAMLSVRINSYEQLRYGDEISMDGTVKKLTTSTSYMKKDGIVGTVDYPKIISVKEQNGFSIKGGLFSIRDSMAQVYKKTLNQNESALMVGILLGQESADFPADFKQAMKNSGTTHITALSGYNITILISALFYVLSFLFSRKTTFWVSIVGIILFVIMTGAQSSVIRAALMGSLVIIAQRLSRIYSFKQAMAVSAFAMLIANPLVLKFDVGFVLSFLSLAGITYVAPIVATFIAFRNEIVEKIKKLFCETFAAQVAVLPVLSAYFGGFSLAGLVSNILVLPLIPITMFIGFVAGIAGMIWMPLANLFSFVLSLPLALEVGIIKLFGSISQIQAQFGIIAVVAYYIILVALIFKYKQRLEAYEYII